MQDRKIYCELENSPPQLLGNYPIVMDIFAWIVENFWCENIANRGKNVIILVQKRYKNWCENDDFLSIWFENDSFS